MNRFRWIVFSLTVSSTVLGFQSFGQEQQPAESSSNEDGQAAPADEKDEALPPSAPGQQKAAPNAAPAAKAQEAPPPKPPADAKPAAPPATPPLRGGAAVPLKPMEPARVSLDQQRIQKLIDQLRQEMPKQSPAINVKLIDGVVTRRAIGPGLDLELHGEGGWLGERVSLYALVTSLMQKHPYWSEWLKHNGVYISYSNPPGNQSDLTIDVVPNEDEAANIAKLLQVLLDEIELNVPLHGAFVEAASLVKPTTGPGLVLQVNGRIIDEIQRAQLQRALDQSAASLEWWRDRRRDIFLSLDSVVVGPLDRMRSNRYFTIALEAFWRGDYVLARDAFARALSDEPTSRLFQYWRVIVHIAMHEEDRARRKLFPLLVDDPWGSNGPEIAVALERLQGPLRWRLRELEQEVLMTMLP